MPRPEIPCGGPSTTAAVILLTCQWSGEAAGQQMLEPRMFRLEALDCPGKAPKRAVVVVCAGVDRGGPA